MGWSYEKTGFESWPDIPVQHGIKTCAAILSSGTDTADGADIDGKVHDLSLSFPDEVH